MPEEIKYKWENMGNAKTPDATPEPEAQVPAPEDNSGYTYVTPDTPQSAPEPESIPEPASEDTPEPAPVIEPESTPEPAPEAKVPEQTPEPAPVPEPKSKRAIDAKTQEFLDWQEKTGRSIEDWSLKNRDLSKLNPIDIAKDKIREDNTGVDLTDEEVNFLLEEELGFDPTESDLDAKEKVLFKKFYGSQLSKLRQEQAIYDTPVEGYEPDAATEPIQPKNGEMVKLTNGTEISAEEYQRERQAYLSQREESLKDLGAEKFKVSFDGKDGKKEYEYSYEYNDQDRHGMLSITEDVGSIIQNYQDEAGKFNHSDFNKDLWWTQSENRNKAISAIISKVRSEVIDEQISQRRNLNFNSPSQPSTPSKNDGYHKVGDTKQGSKFGVKFPFNN